MADIIVQVNPHCARANVPRANDGHFLLRSTDCAQMTARKRRRANVLRANDRAPLIIIYSTMVGENQRVQSKDIRGIWSNMQVEQFKVKEMNAVPVALRDPEISLERFKRFWRLICLWHLFSSCLSAFRMSLVYISGHLHRIKKIVRHSYIKFRSSG